jgi:CMP-N-acetylneuraminic acid synthetase
MVTAVIPIKTNNQRLPGKNTRMLGTAPLYHYIFRSIKACKLLDRIIVDSSDIDILAEARTYGFEELKRPKTLNAPETSGHDLINFEISNFGAINEDDIFVQVFVTLPFLTSSTIDKSIKLLQDNEASSVLALYKVHDRFWYDGKPVSHTPKNLSGTQYEPPLYREAGFYTFNINAFIKEQSRITSDHVELIIDPKECIDIDTEMDFKYAEAFLDENR